MGMLLIFVLAILSPIIFSIFILVSVIRVAIKAGKGEVMPYPLAIRFFRIEPSKGKSRKNR